MKNVGFIGWRGMVGSVLMDRMPQNQVFLEKMRLCLIFLNKKSPFGDLLIIYLLFSWFSLPFFSAQIYLQI